MVTLLMSKTVLTKAQLAAIGHVAVESTYCEYLVEAVIWKLSGMDEEQGKFFTSPLLMGRRLELLADLWKPRFASEPRKMAKLTKLVSGLQTANEDRNAIIHGHWNMPTLAIGAWMKGARFPAALASKRRLRSSPRQFPATDILATARRISDLTSELWDFAEAEGLLTT